MVSAVENPHVIVRVDTDAGDLAESVSVGKNRPAMDDGVRLSGKALRLRQVRYCGKQE